MLQWFSYLYRSLGFTVIVQIRILWIGMLFFHSDKYIFKGWKDITFTSNMQYIATGLTNTLDIK